MRSELQACKWVHIHTQTLACTHVCAQNQLEAAQQAYRDSQASNAATASSASTMVERLAGQVGAC